MKYLSIATIIAAGILNLNLAHAENVIDEQINCVGTEPFWSFKLDTSHWQDGNYAKPEYVIHSAQYSYVGASQASHYTASEMSSNTSANDSSRFNVSSKINRYKNPASRSVAKPEFSAFIDFRGAGETKCNDGMSDREYPYSLYLLMGNTALTGCCESNLYKAKNPAQ